MSASTNDDDDGVLVTFSLYGVHGAGSVDIHGSWDNFRQAYPLRKDTQMGHGRWWGCHRFEHIICDGDPSARGVQPRKGLLRMGGTYWYFYKVDGDIEIHDGSEPTTNKCPLLPGQVVNVLELPQLSSSSLLSASAEADAVPAWTSSPEMRWSQPVPPDGNPRFGAHLLAPTSSPTLPSTSWRGIPIRRLHTAIAEHVITGFKNFNLDLLKPRPSQLRHRLINTSDGCGKASSHSTDNEALPSFDDPHICPPLEGESRPRSAPPSRTGVELERPVDGPTHPPVRPVLNISNPRDIIIPQYQHESDVSTPATSPPADFSASSSVTTWDVQTPFGSPEIGPPPSASKTADLTAAASQETIKAPAAPSLTIGALAFERVAEEASQGGSDVLGLCSAFGDLGTLSFDS